MICPARGPAVFPGRSAAAAAETVTRPVVTPGARAQIPYMEVPSRHGRPVPKGRECRNYPSSRS